MDDTADGSGARLTLQLAQPGIRVRVLRSHVRIDCGGSPGFLAPQSAHVEFPGTFLTRFCSVRSLRACCRLLNPDDIMGLCCVCVAKSVSPAGNRDQRRSSQGPGIVAQKDKQSNTSRRHAECRRMYSRKSGGQQKKPCKYINNKFNDKEEEGRLKATTKTTISKGKEELWGWVVN
jgi:hypothetical protein